MVVSALLSVFAVTLYFIPKSTDANEVYNQSLYNVVEIKAESENVGESFGTGIILSDNGLIVNNAHVITYTRIGLAKEFDKCFIRFAFEDEYRTVKLEKYDTDIDLAVLSLEDFSDINLKPIKINRTSSLKAGDKVYAVGNAANYGIGIFEGIVSIPLLNIEIDGKLRSVIQCDLAIAAGNSGGALLNDKGELVGITTFRTKDTSGNVIYGIVYCIPLNTLLEYIN